MHAAHLQRKVRQVVDLMGLLPYGGFGGTPCGVGLPQAGRGRRSGTPAPFHARQRKAGYVVNPLPEPLVAFTLEEVET